MNLYFDPEPEEIFSDSYSDEVMMSILIDEIAINPTTDQVNMLSLNYNKKHDELGRFGTSWKPSGTEVEAQKFIVNSKFIEPLYHGTTGEGIKGIMKDGFKMGVKNDRYGKGIYFATDKTVADSHSEWVKDGITLKAYISIDKPFTNKRKFDDMIDEKLRAKKLPIDDFSKIKNFKQFREAINESVDDIFKQDYDALIIKPDDKQMSGRYIIMRDPKKIMVVK